MAALLIYDGDCGFCTRSALWSARRFRSPVDVQPWQAVDLARYRLTARDVTTAAYWVDRAGAVHRGHAAVGRALLAMGGGWPAVGALMLTPPLTLLARAAYWVVARNRHRLPGSTDECRLPTPPR